jgi:hypothetical protein
MANTGFKGISVKQTGSELVFDALLQTSGGALVTTGTATVKLYELQSDGTIKTYDFSNNTFGTGTVTTLTANMSYVKANNSAVDTGLYTYSLGTVTGFTVGGQYYAHVNHSSASPTDQLRRFQYGSAEGDLVTWSAGTTGTSALMGEVLRYGTAQAGGNNTITLDSGASSTTNFYSLLNARVQIVAGTGIGQSQSATAYNGSTKVLTVTANWTTNPDSTSVFIITVPRNVNLVLVSDVTPSTPSVIAANVTQVNGTSFSGALVPAYIDRIQKNQAYTDNFYILLSGTTTGATGKTVAVQVSKDGGAFATAANSPATQIANGAYSIQFTSSEINANQTIILATAGGCDPYRAKIVTNN